MINTCSPKRQVCDDITSSLTKIENKTFLYYAPIHRSLFIHNYIPVINDLSMHVTVSQEKKHIIDSYLRATEVKRSNLENKAISSLLCKSLRMRSTRLSVIL